MPGSRDFGVVFERSPNAYMVLDRDLRFIAANPTYLRLTASRLEDLLGRHIFEIFPHDPSDPQNESAQQLRQSFERVIASRATDVLALIKYRVPSQDGAGHIVLEERYWSATHTPLLDERGEVAFILQHTVDVTELHRLKEAAPAREDDLSAEVMEAGVLGRAQVVQEVNRALDAERRRLRSLFEQAPGFVCFLEGRQHTFDLANRAYFQLIGHRDIVGKEAREALPELVGQGFFTLLDQVFTTGEPFIGRGLRLLIRRYPDTPLDEVFVDFIFQPIFATSGAVTGIFVLGNDITAQKRLEIERERLATIVEESTDFIGVCDLEGNVFFVNEAGQRLVGLEKDGVLTSNLRDYFFPEDRAFVEGTIVPEILAKGHWEGEVHFRSFKTGAAIPMYYNAFGIREPGTSRYRALATISRDITPQKRQEAERAALLQREQAARTDAEQANRLKDEFLATVSHELRTPLNAMLGWVRMLRAGQVAAEKQPSVLETIERNARVQSQVIDDLLDVGRIVSGKLQVQMAPVLISTVVQAAIDTVRPAADAKGVSLEGRCEVDATVLGDAGRLQQVVWNLLSNAVKFTPPGGRVEVLVTRLDSNVDITVTDTGAGIAPEFLPYVFEPFRQADGSTTRAHGGLGLGLSIVKHLVDIHGGTLAVSSEGVGRGASFTVRLPVVASRQAGERPSAPDSRPAAELVYPPEIKGLRLLVVDDEEATRELLRAVLERAGAQVETARSASEAVVSFQQNRPDILLTDIAMPGEDGYSLIRRIRALPADQGGRVPAVALTGHARMIDRTRALMAGFRAHVPKPIEPAELMAVLVALVRASDSS
jgi:PAS domain S-box-containing protein